MYQQTPNAPLTVRECDAILDWLMPKDVWAPNGSFISPYQPPPYPEAVGKILVGFASMLRVRAIWLLPSQQIVAHMDQVNEGMRRFHVPLQTNDQSWVFHDGIWQRLTRGLTYAMDPLKWHGAVNWGSEPRIHLMIE